MGLGTWDLGLEDVGRGTRGRGGRGGRGDAGTRGRGDAGTRGRENANAKTLVLGEVGGRNSRTRSLNST